MTAEIDLKIDGAECNWRLRARIHYSAFGVPRWMPLLPRDFTTDILVRRSGLCLGWIRQSTRLPGGFPFNTQTLAATTPIDENHVRLLLRYPDGHYAAAMAAEQGRAVRLADGAEAIG